MVKPTSCNFARILPALPASTASGLMMARVIARVIGICILSQIVCYRVKKLLGRRSLQNLHLSSRAFNVEGGPDYLHGTVGSEQHRRLGGDAQAPANPGQL